MSKETERSLSLVPSRDERKIDSTAKTSAPSFLMSLRYLDTIGDNHAS